MTQQLEMQPSYAREVVDVAVAEELSESFLAYSLSVITSRAIPDVRDGLKPVQRRILFSMLRMGVRPGAPFRKSARIVGDTMGRYHPHGDSAIYDTLVRMGQDFSRMVPFIEPQGNFGSLDDPPAASRYTECRLAAAAMAMVDEIDENTVDFRPTYDGEGEEPAVLPAALPNILVNGTSGIAVGMATNMAPHNLAEVAGLIRLVMTKRRPKPTIDEMMEALPGPDFPSGGVIINDGLREAYSTGRGSFRIRAKAHITSVTRARKAIIVTELPYLVGPERVISKVQELANSRRLPEVAGITDLSDIKGLRMQIDLKAGVNGKLALDNLYRLTPLEETFGINNVVLVDGVPTTLGIYDLCRCYIDHRLEVIVRRTTHRLGKARNRLHIVEGLLIALDAIDEVVKIIRGSADAAAAKHALIERFLLSEEQATHILEMPLRRLTALAKLELEREAQDLRVSIAKFEKLLGSEAARRTLVLKELDALVAAHGAPRRCRIESAANEGEGARRSLVREAAPPPPEMPCEVTLSSTNLIGRFELNVPQRTTIGRHDIIASRATTSTSSLIGAITSQARAISVAVLDLPEATKRSRGATAGALLGLSRGEKILALLGGGEERLLGVTAKGMGKKVTQDEVLSAAGGGTIIDLADGDELVAAILVPSGGDLVIASSDGQVLRTNIEQFTEKGGAKVGALAMKPSDGAEIVGAVSVGGDEQALLVATIKGRVKATPLSDLSAKGKGGQGMRIAKLAKGEAIASVGVGRADLADVLALVSDYDDPAKVDPNPKPLGSLGVVVSGRGLVPSTPDRKVLAIGPPRWPTS